MAQMTNALSAVDSVVEISVNGTVWTDISGFSNKLDVPAQTRMSGEAYTFDGDTGIITTGKRTPMEITVNALYSEGAAEAFEIVRAQFETAHGAGPLYVRWSPAGNDTGDFRFTTPAGKVVSFQYPAVDGNSPAPIPFTFTVKVPSVTKAVV